MKAIATAVGLLVGGVVVQQGVPPEAIILAPSNGAVIGGPSVKVVLDVAGATIAPVAQQQAGAAHLHLFLDVDATAPGAAIPAGVAGITHLGGGQMEYTFDSLGVGGHRIVVMLGDNAHVAVPGQKSDTVLFTVVYGRGR